VLSAIYCKRDGCLANCIQLLLSINDCEKDAGRTREKPNLDPSFALVVNAFASCRDAGVGLPWKWKSKLGRSRQSGLWVCEAGAKGKDASDYTPECIVHSYRAVRI